MCIYSSYSTSLGEEQYGQNPISHLIIGKCQGCDISTGRGRASWCLLSLRLPEVFCICQSQPALPCLEKPSRDSRLSMSCHRTRQRLLLRPCRHPERRHFPPKAGLCNTMYHQILCLFKDCRHELA